MHAVRWRLWNTFSYLAAALTLLLAETVPLGGRTATEIADMFHSHALPAAYAYSIWGLIYILLGMFVWLQWRPGWRGMSVFRRVGPWFSVSCLFHIMWLLCWHYQYIRSSVFLMIGLALTLIHLYRLTRRTGPSPRDDAGLTARLFIQLPFSLGAAWSTAAAAANVLVGLETAGPIGRGTFGVILALLALAAVAGIALVVFSRRKDTAWLLTAMWAFVAIAVKQQPLAPAFAWFSWLLAAIMALVALRIIRLPILRVAER